ncbi:2-hydroxy-6-oxononadienedioate/2-hydroxy-6-oxononatrienedioate hydrolase [Legionella birminghamensis]|uniref:2-hydroxy-6-oxononadienedioate/2-hydroxy-6-oxononatrienedioate hydrolase n=1 Tax=Legionella birminghamensis TaxID=28083 RepID=A0A378I620_9GAMM|nr:alpha/beta hydrolase [Legionella birminghamensis]KTC73903.1 2-hydroxy-6-oxononadienedioate/2-hydroxy-6-oxononatrienedioate hydrolase [Legionella birminghamensis]STX30453.1 Bem46 protein [Legionella birminghamensis]
MLRNFAIGSVLFIVLGMFFIFLFQRKLIYFPARLMPSPANFHAQDMQIVSLRTKDRLVLQSWYKSAAPGQPTVLFLHGNGGHIGMRMPMARQWIKKGYGVLLLEYRGYSGNPGSPSEKGFYQDAEAAREFLSQQGVSNKHLVIYGESLGAGVATYLSIKNPACALILQSPFTSLTAVARYHYPLIVIPPWDKYDSLSRIRQIKSPLLVLHGDQDRIVPYLQGVELYESANQPKEFVRVLNRGHNNLWQQAFYQRVIQFIEEHCSVKPP